MSHHSQKSSFFLKGGAAAQKPCYHDDEPSQAQDVGGDGVDPGGQQADVVTLLHQCPQSYSQHSAPCKLGGQRRVC